MEKDVGKKRCLHLPRGKKNRQHICLERDAQHLNSRLEDKALFLTNLHSAGQIVQLCARAAKRPVCTILYEYIPAVQP